MGGTSQQLSLSRNAIWKESHDQFNLNRQTLHVKEHTERKKSKRKKESPTSDYLGTGDPPLKPSSCCALSQTSSFARCLKKKPLLLSQGEKEKKNRPHTVCTPHSPRLSNNHPCSKPDTPPAYCKNSNKRA